MRVSLRTLLSFVAAIAVVLAFWARFGEFMIAFSFLVLLAGDAITFLLPSHGAIRMFRRVATTAIVVLLLFIASFGPATWAYTTYDPGLYASPKSKRLLLLVYSPVGRCISFPTGVLRDSYLAYLRWCMPRGISVQDLGWGVKIESKHQHVYIGMD